MTILTVSHGSTTAITHRPSIPRIPRADVYVPRIWGYPPTPGGVGISTGNPGFYPILAIFRRLRRAPTYYPSFVPICKDRNNDHIIVNIENKIITKCHSFGCKLHPRTHLKCDLGKQERETNSLNRCYRALKTDQRIQLTEIKLMSY